MNNNRFFHVGALLFMLILSGLLLLLIHGTRHIEMPRYIAHAGGTLLDGTTGSNSVEAANLTYEKGFRWLEIDFCWTSDRQLVCLHDWDAYYTENKTGIPAPCTAAQFETMRKTTYNFESFTVPVIKTWLDNHPDAMIVTDVKEDNIAAMTWIAENYPELKDRLVVQIYHPDEFTAVSELGFPNIILTMYRLTWEEQRDYPWLTDFIKKSGIIAVSILASDECKDVFDAVLTTGIPIYVHTLNTLEDQQLWFNQGAYGVFFDYIK